MGWTLFFMIVILKIPMVAALWLVWYAVRDVPQPEEEGTTDEERGPKRKPPRPPRWPRRGPVVGGGDCKPVPCPQQVTERIKPRVPAFARRNTE